MTRNYLSSAGLILVIFQMIDLCKSSSKRLSQFVLKLTSQFSDGQSIFIKFFRNFTDPYYYAVRGGLLISVHRYF